MAFMNYNTFVDPRILKLQNLGRVCLGVHVGYALDQWKIETTIKEALNLRQLTPAWRLPD